MRILILCLYFRLIGEVDAFDVGQTFDPKTFGIWMGTKILVGKDKNGKEMAILLLDTEGIGKEVFLRLNQLNLSHIDHEQHCNWGKGVDRSSASSKLFSF